MGGLVIGREQQEVMEVGKKGGGKAGEECVQGLGEFK